MSEQLSFFLEDSTPFLWVLGICIVIVAWTLIGRWRSRRLVRALHAVVGSFEKPLLFYDEHDNLVFYTSGLILFDKNAARQIRKLDRRPPPDRELIGEIEIDSNTYRYHSRLLEYKPATFGTIVYLDYHSSNSVRQ